MSAYRTLVADPPWPMPATGKTTPGALDDVGPYVAKGGRRMEDGSWWRRSRGSSVELPYGVMELEDIAALPVQGLAAPDACLYLWTTNRFLEQAYGVARAWGFRPTQVLTWCKPPMGLGFGGAFASTTEFVLLARRGSPGYTRRQDSTWWQWSRPYEGGHIAHSAKPEAFLDLVEQVSPGPYVELFARRNRLGWDTWGHEALPHVELGGLS